MQQYADDTANAYKLLVINQDHSTFTGELPLAVVLQIDFNKIEREINIVYIFSAGNGAIRFLS